MSELLISDDLFDNLASIFGDIHSDVSSNIWENEAILSDREVNDPKRSSDEVKCHIEIAENNPKRVKSAEEDHVDQAQTEEKSWRLFLLRLPRMIVDGVNSGEIEEVIDLLQMACTEDCSIKTPSILESLVGRRHVVEFFQLFSTIFPDTVLYLHKTKLVGGVITSAISFCATKTFEHPNEAKFCNFKNAENPEDAEFRQKANEIEASGGNYALSGTVTLNFVLDKSLTKIVRLELERQLQDVQRAKRPNFGLGPVNVNPSQLRESLAFAVQQPVNCMAMPRSTIGSLKSDDDDDDECESDDSRQDVSSIDGIEVPHSNNLSRSANVVQVEYKQIKAEEKQEVVESQDGMVRGLGLVGEEVCGDGGCTDRAEDDVFSSGGPQHSDTRNAGHQSIGLPTPSEGAEYQDVLQLTIVSNSQTRYSFLDTMFRKSFN